MGSSQRNRSVRYIRGEIFNRWILILPVFSFVWAVAVAFGLWPVLYLLIAAVVGAIVWGMYIGDTAQNLWRFFISKGIFLRCIFIIMAIIMAMVVVLFGGYIAFFAFPSAFVLFFFPCLQLILGAIMLRKFGNRKSSVSVLKSTSSFVRYVIITLVSLVITYTIWGMSTIIGFYFLGLLVAESVMGQSGVENFQELVGYMVLAFLVLGVFMSVVLFVLVRILIHILASLRLRAEV